MIGTTPEDEAALEVLDFPGPRADCVGAVSAARRYIYDNDGATKAEIVRALVPEENYPIGHNGVAASAKGVVPGFREWWWAEIVEPGLHVLPDIVAPAKAEGQWQPVDLADR